MRVWILHVGEELPVDPKARTFRYGHLAKQLTERGHEVLRWAPTFQHFRKEQRFDADTRLAVDSRYDIQFVHSKGYKRNVSIARLRAYRELATKARRLFQEEQRPDLILAGIPSLEWCEAAVDFGRQHGVPVVIDVRDLWPDIYTHALPPRLRSLARVPLLPFFWQARRVCRLATALIAVSDSYLKWGLQNAGRDRRETDRVFPLGYSQPVAKHEERTAQLNRLKELGVDPRRTICLFVGLLEKSYDIDGIIQAAKRLEQRIPGEYQFVVCGAGTKLARLQRASRETPSIVPLGWVEPAAIHAAMSISHIGLAAYTSGALQSLPNKPFEYLSGGLPVVTSLKGELPRLLHEHQCGNVYQAGNGASLADAVVSLTHEKSSLDSAKSRARVLFEEHFQAESICGELADHLQQIRHAHLGNTLTMQAA